ncbi:glyceraldehyde 3-phosphate dehydrogenase NAD-binding domain-containing protein [Salinivibrio kushneri]|uniref:glyceraldehyde 3-phosphate dehydrogenase NAD-binding domain-containing protein n=1 Tax=Salinivibrio kushneri TaxID=1908198 RepID=UPI000989044E|nr:glyceraldehyde 3-phosphate dehydrogenase NAD-binding domain-containing protein [Salinivibrio kushneri]OOE48393.1 hypothetical protein BZG10_11590 [Salinivibrio kushneri]
MTIKVGINGFGRIGRLALRAAFDWPELEFVHINDVAGDTETLAHLLEFDSVQGRWHHAVSAIAQSTFTTIHDLTNTQTILDAPHKDLRRARACGMSLIPTTTGSATAIVEIFPDLKGKINGHAVRVPLANASLTDVIFDVETDTTAEEVNALLQEAADGELKGILGFEARPLVSIDYRGDQRSTIVDGLSTMVVGKRMVKIYAWYDNEMGYATRTAELVRNVGLVDQ